MYASLSLILPFYNLLYIFYTLLYSLYSYNYTNTALFFYLYTIDILQYIRNLDVMSVLVTLPACSCRRKKIYSVLQYRENTSFSALIVSLIRIESMPKEYYITLFILFHKSFAHSDSLEITFCVQCIHYEQNIPSYVLLHHRRRIEQFLYFLYIRNLPE